MKSVDVACCAAQAASDKKATDITVLDISNFSDMCDCLVIGTVSNSIQAQAVVDEIEDRVYEQCCQKPHSIEGQVEGTWVLIDYGNIVVHIFQEEAREYYRLENLWAKGTPVEFNLD